MNHRELMVYFFHFILFWCALSLYPSISLSLSVSLSTSYFLAGSCWTHYAVISLLVVAAVVFVSVASALPCAFVVSNLVSAWRTLFFLGAHWWVAYRPPPTLHH